MVEIMPRKSKLILQNWRWPLWLSFVLFFLTVLVFMSLKIYLSRIQANVIDVNNKIKIEAGKVNVNDENSVLRLNDSLNVFSRILANHSYFSKFLDLLSSLTYANVVFTKVYADKDTGIIQLGGVAQNYTALAKQMVALRENENIKNLDVKGINFGTSGLGFDFTVGVDSKIFTR